MRNKKGFTLTEILLAVMIVGIIGVALAALTTAASRESGVGRSKVLLRNNLSIALRQLRRDVQESSRVLYVRGGLGYSLGVSIEPLLMLGKNIDQAGASFSNNLTPTYVVYCFERGAKNKTSSGANVLPSGAYDGGVIYRYEVQTETEADVWDGNLPKCNTSKKFLNNVKYIPGTTITSSETGYPSPYFHIKGFSGTYNVKTTAAADVQKNLGSVLGVNLVTELPSNPVVNDVTEEIFILPNGFGIKN